MEPIVDPNLVIIGFISEASSRTLAVIMPRRYSNFFLVIRAEATLNCSMSWDGIQRMHSGK